MVPPSRKQDEASRDNELQWLIHHQSALDARLQRVEESLVFRTLRAVGTFYQTHFASDTGRSAQAWSAWFSRHLPAAIAPDPLWAYQPVIDITADGGDLETLRSQTYAHWEIGGTSGDYTAELRPGTKLSPHTLAYAVRAMQGEKPGRIYFDHQQLDESGEPLRPVFKPDWSPTLIASCDYLGDFILTAREPREGTVHIPEVLYSTTRSLQLRAPERPARATPTVSILICTRNAGLLSRCLASLRGKTDYSFLEVLVVHHTGSADDAEIERIAADHGAARIPFAGPFNFSVMNNLGAEAATGELLVFLNDDVEPLEANWLGRLAGWFHDASVGAVGAKLLYPNGAIQHAGIATWIVDGAGHPGRNLTGGTYWPWLNVSREVTAVTGACLCLRRVDFQRIGGFNPDFPVNYNDVDLCLRLREQGLSVIYDAGAVLQHDESRTRARGVTYEERRRFFLLWAARLQQVDPFYSPHLAQNNENLSLRG